MSDSSSSPPAPGARKSRSYLTPLLVLLLVGVAASYYVYVLKTEGAVPAPDELGSLQPMVAELAKYRKLDGNRYLDADGNLIADAPTDAGKWRDPAELQFVGIPTDFADAPEDGRAVWKDLLDRLAKATGKKAVFAEQVKTYEGQLNALRDGSLQITAFSTGQVPGAVNTAGFVPLVCPADDKGNFSYEMEILVRPDSPVKTAADLRGKDVAFSAMSSNSGSRAPMVVLHDEFKLLPGKDYHFVFTGDQLKSLQALAAGKHDAICVANDFYQRQVADPKNKLSAGQFRSIYKSKSFPPLCFGVAYDLKPELRAKIEETLRSFPIAGSSVGTKFREPRFAPVNYKLDWAFVREVDDSLSRLPSAK